VAESDPAAEGLVSKALDEQEQFVGKFPEIPEYAAVLGRDYYKMGRILAGRGDWAGAVRFLDRAIAHHRAVAAADPANPTFRSYLGDDFFVLAFTRVKQQNHAAAAKAAEQLPRLLPHDFQRYGDAAAILVECAEAAGDDQERAESYLGRAVKVLVRAADLGLIATPKRLDDRAFNQIRERNDFKRLLEGLQGKRGEKTLGVRPPFSG
jgi:tetratricopeptide (TPR) repeat protein